MKKGSFDSLRIKDCIYPTLMKWTIPYSVFFDILVEDTGENYYER
jgi:hypothetical protein